MITSVKLSCPACQKITKVYHLEWEAIKCTKCKNYVYKHEWQLAYSPITDKSQKSKNRKLKKAINGKDYQQTEKETQKIFKTLEEWNS